MVEKIVPVTHGWVRAACNECDGELLFTGVTDPGGPPQHWHACVKCGNRLATETIYPRSVMLDPDGKIVR